MKSNPTMMIFMWFLTRGLTLHISSQLEDHYLMKANEPLGVVLRAAVQPDCFVLFVTDDKTSSYSGDLVKALNTEESPGGFAVFSLPLDSQDTNTTDVRNDLIILARKLRRSSWCTFMVVVSVDPEFLLSFAEDSQRGRLLVWTTRLIIVTRLLPQQRTSILRLHWTFSMMNAIFLNLEMTRGSGRWSVYSHLPYSPQGAKDVTVPVWSNTKGIIVTSKQYLFPEKYSNFYGAVVNVTSRHHPPYWIEEEYTREDGTLGQSLSGTDGTLIKTVAKALNFTIYNMPTKNWDEVLDFIVARKSFISPVIWLILPQRVARFDMTYVYEWSPVSFSKAKPLMGANWQSLKDPLSNEVWLSILACVFIAPGILYMIGLAIGKMSNSKHVEVGSAIQAMIGTLLGQNFTMRLLRHDSGRILMFSWLIFTFIIGAAYRGNLTAHLTLPKFPPRPENLEQLVEAVDEVLGSSYHVSLKEFFSKSDNQAYRKLGSLIVIGTNMEDGLKKSLKNTR